jgi:hypothetical protein
MTVKPSPLEIFMTEYLPPAEAAAVATQVATIQEPPKVTALADLRPPVYGNDPNELIKHRWLYRGAMALFCGPTGVGKSAWLLQAAMHWAVGKAFFDLMPGEVFQRTGMRILIVQAENDEGDMAEMFLGVLAGCDELSAAEKELAGRRVFAVTVSDKSSDAFVAVLDHLIQAGTPQEGLPYDIVIVDPAFAYLGGDGLCQKEVSHFMRELLNPLVQRLRVGLLVAHHTNKPLRGREKDGWEAGDYAYLGAGSAEWINPVRAAVAIRSVGSDTVFELRAVKRGKRLRWTDANGQRTTVKLIRHDDREGVICWHPATPADAADLEAAAKGGRPKRFDAFECVHAIIHRPGESQTFYVDLVSGALECGKETVRQMIKSCVKAGWIGECGDQQFRRYQATGKGQHEAENRPSGRNWTSQ